MYKWVLAGQTVSCAAIMRQTPNIGIVGLVFTPTELRGQGFASGCVWNLSSFILNSGLRYAGLFTDVSNPVSNEIYKKIGYLPFSEFLDVNFCMNDDI
jgi:predicted GNAT family acetyltransferase